MADQDAQDINQMMSASSDVMVAPKKRSMLVWIVLGCVVLGVGLGIVVYTQSTKPAPVVKSTPRPTVVAVVASPTPKISPMTSPVATVSASPVTPQINVVNPVNSTGSGGLGGPASASPSASVRPSVSPSPSPSPSTRAAMPDTSEGVPVTGVLEVTVATVSIGILLLTIGLFGLLAL